MSRYLDFEEDIINREKKTVQQFKKSKTYLFLRIKMIQRWEILNKFHSYPNMLKPLKITKNL